MRISDYEGADYEGNFWRIPGREYDDRIERIAMKRLLPTSGRLLELASGYGRLTNLYAAFRQVVLVDYTPSHLEAARSRYGDEGYLYVAADICNMPFAPAQFDAATMVRALHHMDNPQLALESTRRVLRRGGILVVEYNNKHNLKTILKWAARRMPGLGSRWADAAYDPFSKEPVEYYSLYFGLHPDHVAEMLLRSGLVPERRLATAYLRLPALARIVPTEVLVRLDAALQLTGRWFHLSPSGFVRARAVGGDEPLSKEVAFWLCPGCHGMRLQERDDGLLCLDCDREWPRKNGIYDFRFPVASDKRVSVAATTGW